MAHSAFNVINGEHVQQALAEYDAGVDHPYRDGTKFELVLPDGRIYPPKAIVGLAFRRATGSFPPKKLLRGGEGFANDVLTSLGYTVQLIAGTGEDWTDDECRLIVADYFDMLDAELRGEKYNKSAHNEKLREVVRRSRGSVERKHMNVSAVMVELALPYIVGYKPNLNRQQRLVDAVESYINDHPEFFDRPEVVSRLEPKTALDLTIHDPDDFFDDPPDVDIPQRPHQPWKSKKGRRIDYAVRDAANRELGLLGERFAVDLERRRLVEAGRDDLAGKVKHVSVEDGDGCGYDVLSFDPTTEAERWLEVKTTTLGKFHPFLVSANEVACSEAEPERFHLFRVFEFRDAPKVFILPGSLRDRCQLVATAFRACPPYNVEDGPKGMPMAM